MDSVFQSIDTDSLLWRCHISYGWLPSYAHRILHSYFQFLQVKEAMEDFEGTMLVPSRPVELMWKEHRTETTYATFCRKFCGRFLMSNIAEGQIEDPRLIERTQTALKARFGRAIDDEMWSFDAFLKPPLPLKPSLRKTTPKKTKTAAKRTQTTPTKFNNITAAVTKNRGTGTPPNASHPNGTTKTMMKSPTGSGLRIRIRPKDTQNTAKTADAEPQKKANLRIHISGTSEKPANISPSHRPRRNRLAPKRYRENEALPAPRHFLMNDPAIPKGSYEEAGGGDGGSSGGGSKRARVPAIRKSSGPGRAAQMWEESFSQS